jgi:drug/metabolite transporter (DMT)-like permease
MALWGAVFVAVKSGERSGVPGLELAAGRALPAGAVLGAIAMLRMRPAALVRRDYVQLAAINTIFLKKAAGLDPIVANAIQFLAAGFMLLVASVAFGEHLIWTTEPTALGSVAYISLAATAFAYVLWMRAVSLLTVSRASVLLFLVPVFGLLWG